MFDPGSVAVDHVPEQHALRLDARGELEASTWR
jgi:hypothetical protein